MLSACATTSPSSACRAGETAAVLDSLYFGRSMPDGEVKPEEWQEFLATVITPRFPEGLTSWPADGQWRNNTGELVKESSYVLQLAHADSPQTENAVQEAMSIYKNRFHQRAVLRIRTPTCMSF
jgi:hypothetical protein